MSKDGKRGGNLYGSQYHALFTDGYFHSEFRKGLSTKERAMVDRVVESWEDHRRKL